MRIKAKAPLAIAIGSLLTFAALTAIFRLFPLPFVLTLSASMPRGLYRIVSAPCLRYGMLVLFVLPPETAAELQDREWLKKETPLIKPVAALPGDVVCIGNAVSINGLEQGKVYISDFQGKPLRSPNGCFTVPGQAFLPLSTHSERSFDGRYFGQIPQNAIIGEAIPVFTW